VRAFEDPKGMTVAELEAAIRQHHMLYESYSRMADKHGDAMYACGIELEIRKGHDSA